MELELELHLPKATWATAMAGSTSFVTNMTKALVIWRCLLATIGQLDPDALNDDEAMAQHEDDGDRHRGPPNRRVLQEPDRVRGRDGLNAL